MSYYDMWKLDSGYEDGDAPEPVKIVTNYWPKPIPDRRWDWTAITDDYAGEIDDPIGYGATEKEAMVDLQTQLEDES